jgi:predicted membrane protein
MFDFLNHQSRDMRLQMFGASFLFSIMFFISAVSRGFAWVLFILMTLITIMVLLNLSADFIKEKKESFKKVFDGKKKSRI